MRQEITRRLLSAPHPTCLLPGCYDHQRTPEAPIHAELLALRKENEFLRQQLQISQENLKLALIAQRDAVKYDLRGAQFGGGFAESVRGNQIGSIQEE